MPFSYLKRSAAARLRGRWMTNESWYSVKPAVGSSGHSAMISGGVGEAVYCSGTSGCSPTPP
jgi:hypothetical protein